MKAITNKKILILIIFLSFALMLGVSVNTLAAADGDTIYVSSSGDDANSGLTLAEAKKTIKNATDTVNPGGTVIIADGTYSGKGNSNINLDKGMTIKGNSQSGTILNGLSSSRIFAVNSGCTVTIKDLTIMGGNSGFGGGVFNEGYLTVVNCKFTKCTTSYAFMGGGSAICSGDDSTLNVQDSVFTDNDASASTAGGTIYTNGTTTIDNCDFTGNYANDGAVVYSFNGNINMNGCRFVSNTASRYGGVLSLYSTNSVVNIHNSAFINNVARGSAASKNIDNRAGNYLNVTENWWGSNDGPNGISGTITDGSSWIYAKLYIERNFIQYGDNTNVAFDLNNLYHSDTDTFSYKNVEAILDGYMVDFSSNLGTLNPAQDVVDGGIVLSVFTSNNVGTATITATLNNHDFSNNIPVEPAVTTLSTNNASGYNGRTVNLAAKLSSQISSLPGKNITFKVNGVEIGSAITGSNGIANLVYNITQTQGTYNITADFNGDTKCLASTSNGTLTVNVLTTSIAVDNVSTYNGKTVSLNASLTDQNGDPVAGKNVTFKINGTAVGNATTNENGIASLNYTVTQTEGNYNLTADFVGDYVYVASTGAGDLKVNVINTNFIVNDIKSLNGKTVNLTANLTDVNGTPLAGKTITFNLNGDIAGTAVTGTNGVATLNYKLNKSGNYSITADFAGDYVYVASRGTGEAEVIPVADLYLNSKVSSDGLKAGDKFVIIYKLGNKGLDTAKNVTITFKLPEGLEFQDIAADSGNWTYNSATRTVTWTLNSVPVGDPYLFLSVKATTGGIYTITPSMTSSTYNLNTGGNGAITMQVQQSSSNSSTTNSKVISALTTIGMQKTGFPLNYIILAVLIVLGGLGVAKRK